MLRKTLLQFQLIRRDHRIVIPVSLTSQNNNGGKEQRFNAPSLGIASLVDDAGANELKSRTKLSEFRKAVAQQNEAVWKGTKSHVRRQEALVEKFGVEGAVRETLQPSTVSFTKELMSRPLDRKILEEIYRGLHGRRIERKLKRGVSWEHWIAKGDGNAPVFNTSRKSQQTFGYGGKLIKVASAKHEKHFPSSRRARTEASVSALPEVAFFGRTNSGKSSLVNALVNSFICPYGHLQGTTASCDFYKIAGKLMLVDLPGYGYYSPLSASQLDAENAVRVLKQYISHCSQDVEGVHQQHGHAPRNIKRAFVCVSSRGMQHLDIQYIEMLERNRIPFSVVLTKTDRAPIRFLARLADYTRCQLVHYKYCKELFLVSSLRLAGVDKIQDLIAGVALDKDLGDDELSMKFDQIV